MARGCPGPAERLYATADLGPADDMLLLIGHLDTVDVAANWQADLFEAVERDGKLYGLGSFDMKSGLVCAFAAFKALVEASSLHGKLGKIAFAATVDEEGLGLGARALLETEYGQGVAYFFQGDPPGAASLCQKRILQLYLDICAPRGFSITFKGVGLITEIVQSIGRRSYEGNSYSSTRRPRGSETRRRARSKTGRR